MKRLVALRPCFDGSAGIATADPWKDESGNGKRGGYGGYERFGGYGYGGGWDGHPDRKMKLRTGSSSTSS